MAQESISNANNKTVAIVGGGPSGCICAYYLERAGFEVNIFDKGKFLRTLLPTGGGRCNLAHAEYDFRELAKNYPRGEKFLYSVFSRFGTSDTIDFFNNIGVKTYIQDDNRIFPTSNSAEDVRNKLLNSIRESTFIKEKVTEISPLENSEWMVKTEKSTYLFNYVIVAVGGHAGFNIINNLNINIIPPTQALVGLVTKEDFSSISGVSVNDILFTHKGISGPKVYKISSINARREMPYTLKFNLVQEFDLQEFLDKNPHKEIKNLLGEFIPKSLAIWILNNLQTACETPCHRINGKTRNKIYDKLTNFEVTVIEKVPDGEVVTCGGVDLKEIHSKTLESKKYPNLYFCGEVLDIDGFCGGFNLQNCWSTGYIVAQSISNKY